MPKPSATLSKLQAQAEAKYSALFHAKVAMLMQMGQDAATIAASDTLKLGPGRAEAFCAAYRVTMNEIARMAFEDQQDDAEFIYAKSKVDERLKRICGDKFAPWEERYG